MGASHLDKGQLNKIVKQEAWAYEMRYRHIRECTEKICGGKSKMWWLLRHPTISREIANPEARKFVVTGYHVCGKILERLESGSIPWLPRERATYAKRTDARILRLLGRDQTPEPVEAPPDPGELSDPFPGLRESFPETQTERRRRERLAWRAAHADRPIEGPMDRPTDRPTASRYSDAYPGRMAENGLQGTLDALTRRR